LTISNIRKLTPKLRRFGNLLDFIIAGFQFE